MRIDARQECVGGCALREELDRLIGDSGNGGQPELGVLVGEETCLAGISDGEVRLARLHIWPTHVHGVRPVLDGGLFIASEDELRKAWILRVLRSRLVRERVARGGERRDGKHGKGQSKE